MRSSVLVTILSLLVPFCYSHEQDHSKMTDENFKGVYFSTNDQYERFLHEFDYEEEETYEEPTDGVTWTGPKPLQAGTAEYEYHIRNLKAVNGYKPRNLYIKSSNPRNPYFYLTNAVQARLPHPFVPQEDMKDVLWNRIKLQKDIINERNRDKLRYIPDLHVKYDVYGRRSNPKATQTSKGLMKKTTTTTTTPRIKVTPKSVSLRKKMEEAFDLVVDKEKEEEEPKH